VATADDPVGVEVTYSEMEPAPSRLPASPGDEAESTEVDPTHAMSASQSSPRPTHSTVETGPGTPVPETDETCLPPEERPSVGWDRFNPEAVARAGVHLDGTVSGSATDAGVEPHDQGERLGEALGQGLREYALTKRHLSKRTPPRLRNRGDGSYRYESLQFDALIHPDGRVEFSDQSVQFPYALVPLMVFDLTDAIMRANGEDPYQHERAWFMRETRELRGQLADRADAADARRGMRELRQRLTRIWEDEALSAQVRRRRIFDLWDDCADDELGARARTAVIRFIRERLPSGSPDAYPETEIRALNATRLSPVLFVPYG